MLSNKKQNTLTVGLVAAALSAVLLTSPVLAKGDKGGKERGKKPDRKQRSAMVFKRLDTNKDNVLELDEFTLPSSTKAEKRFTRKDADEDGLLTFEEATSGREQKDFSDIAEEIVQCVADLKAETGNEDIVVPDAERFMSPQNRFSTIDTSGDELLDLAEVQANAAEKAAKAFEKMDADADLLVTIEEFKANKKGHMQTRRAVKSCVEELTADEPL